MNKDSINELLIGIFTNKSNFLKKLEADESIMNNSNKYKFNLNINLLNYVLNKLKT